MISKQARGRARFRKKVRGRAHRRKTDTFSFDCS